MEDLNIYINNVIFFMWVLEIRLVAVIVVETLDVSVAEVALVHLVPHPPRVTVGGEHSVRLPARTPRPEGWVTSCGITK